MESLGQSPFVHCKADDDPFLRELPIPFGRSGCVVVFEIKDAATLTILSVRHEPDDDFH